MPIYEFDCRSCEARFELLADAGTERATCPECGAAEAERRLSMFGVTARQLTPNQRRRLEEGRGIDRDGARSRFKEGLAKARRRAKRGGGQG